jgi:hypothetical protein
LYIKEDGAAMKRKSIVSWSVALSCCAWSGCQTLPPDWKKHIPWSAEANIKASEFETPERVVAIWSPDILAQPGKPPTRGFGGRLYFYNDKSQAIPVEGQLVVFGYDDSQPDHPAGDPDRRFAFTPEQFKSHYSKSYLGASYSVWIPWDVVGGEQRTVSLVPVFTSTNGKIVMGQQAKNMLPGKKSEQTDGLQPASAISRVQPASGWQPLTAEQRALATEPIPAVGGDPAIGGDPAALPSIRADTITLPRSMQLRLQQSPFAASVPVPTVNVSQPNWGLIQTSSHTITAPAPGVTANQPLPGNWPPMEHLQPPSAPSAAPAAERLRSTHFEPTRFPVRGAPPAGPAPGAAPWGRFHAAPPSPPASPP